MRTTSVVGALVVAAIAAPANAAVYTFTSAPVTFIDEDQVSTPIVVSGLTGRLTNVSIRLNGFNHTFPEDMVFGLFNSVSQSGIVFMSAAGGGTDAVNLNLTFSDQAAAQLPATLASGTYRPSNYDGYTFGNNLTTFAGFAGLSPNATWTLESFDTAAGDVGTLSGGYTLTLTTAEATGAVPEPASWALMIAGFGMAGTALRRRRVRVAFAA